MLYVLLQFGLAAVIVLSSSLQSITMTSWILIALGITVHGWGLTTMGWRRLSILPHVHHRTELITSAPYNSIRHPMYTGLMIACFGLIFCPYAHWRPLVWFGLCITLYAKARTEERALQARFSDYRAYRQSTWMFIPWLI